MLLLDLDWKVASYMRMSVESLSDVSVEYHSDIMDQIRHLECVLTICVLLI